MIDIFILKRMPKKFVKSIQTNIREVDIPIDHKKEIKSNDKNSKQPKKDI